MATVMRIMATQGKKHSLDFDDQHQQQQTVQNHDQNHDHSNVDQNDTGT